MRIDTNIILALDAFAKENKLSKMKLAEKLGVSGATITKWHRVGSGIVTSRWDNQLFQLLKPYLPKERIYIDDAGVERYSSVTSKQSTYFFEPKYIPVKVPAFTMDEISCYDDTLDSIMQFAQNTGVENVEFRPKSSQRVSSVFAIKSDNNRLTNFPFKSLTLFVSSSDRPLDSGLVLVRPINGTVFVGEYKREGQNFTVTEIGGSQSISGEVTKAKRFISWIFPVLYTEAVTF